ncbi:MAG TPA: hypothetical protein VNJ46_09675 [Gaiellaceae bacterium]|nr:hypothetical protein [Gaiellaceae bacterium]
MTETALPPDLEEREVDLASARERLAERWWLPAAGLFLGAVAGLALALAGGSVWRAQTILYLGQPFAPLGGGQIQTLATNPRTAADLVRSEAALAAAARASRMTVQELRGSISTKELVAPGQARGTTPLFELTVKAPSKRKAEAAATALAERLVRNVSAYVEDKVRLLERQLAVSRAQLEAVERRIQDAQEQQERLQADPSIPTDQKLILTLNLNSVITTADARRASLQEDLYEAQQLLNLADSVEMSRIVEPPTASRSTARSGRTSLLVGALLGLLLGAVAALAAEPFLARRRALR